MNDLHCSATRMLATLELTGAPSVPAAAWGKLAEDDEAVETLRRGVWNALERPGPLATNFRLIDSDREVDPSKWRKSRVGDGEIVHTELDSSFVQRAVSSGATLVVGHIDTLDAGVGRMCEALEYLLLARVWANCYIAYGSESAFGSHSDCHDVIVVQLVGRKRWEVDQGSSLPGAVTDRYLTLELTPGEFLGIPAKMTHFVSGLDELSIHLTFGFEPFAGMPARIEEAASLLDVESVELSAADLRSRLAQLPDRRAGASWPTAATGIPGEQARIRWSSRFPPIVAMTDEGTVVKSRGKTFRFGSRAHSTIVALAEGREYSLPSLLARGELTDHELRRFVNFCVQHDLAICQG